MLSKNAMATLLICTEICLNKNDNLVPFSLDEWNSFASVLLNSRIENLDNLFHADKNDLINALGMSKEESERLLGLLSKAGMLGFEIESLEKIGIKILSRGDKEYPFILKKNLKMQSPPVIFYSGNPALFNRKGVAVINQPSVDNESEMFIQKFSEKAYLNNLNIITGGNNELNNFYRGCRFISVLPGGMKKKMMEKETRESIMNSHLLLLSTVVPSLPSSQHLALERNKIIYGLSSFGIVINSNSGKEIINGALENIENEIVPLYVRTGKNVPESNNKIIKNGGIPFGEEYLNDKNFDMNDLYLSPDKFRKHNDSVSLF